ncbi:extracellular solute-binding protein [Paenibacillus alkaliterrae]|uniref:extracellular solute-binding protein n=1 Tax=Paenibacillus alkaliterrae TaxID=320909 RepID=UPI001F164BE3|nr:extracellular solute-binding protein [Paenibacillus alkaliterrae]MCF2939384.1 extracellular solute-binding protein [Paenibacillus alkaliterrae]
MHAGKRWMIVLIVLMITGCGQQSIISEEGTVERLRHGQNVDITFWHTYSDEETRILEDLIIPSFEKDNPLIHVVPIRQANNAELKYTLISKASANRAPDVVRMDIAWVPEFSQSGLLLPLSDYSDFGDVTKLLQSNTGSAGYYEGHHYSLPVNMNTKAAIFSKALLEKAGLDVPPSTFEEVIELAREHRFKIGMGGMESWSSLPYVYALGGRMTNDTYSAATGYLNGAATIKAVEELVSLYNDKLIDRTVIKGGADNWEGVKTGNILMTDEGPWFYSVFQGGELERAVRSTIAVPFPAAYGPSSVLGGEDLVILRGSENPIQAWEFMKWMIRKDTQVAMSQTGLIPTNLEAKEMKANRESFIHPYAVALDQTFLRPPVKAWSRIDEIYAVYMAKIFQGELSVEDGLTQAAGKIDQLLIQ